MITVITPTLNEAKNLPLRAAELRAQETDWEWIVVDGHSDDDSVKIGEQLGAQVLQTQRSRGAQLNAGAQQACGDILLFLHADTRLPPRALMAIEDAVSQRGAIGGNFALSFQGQPIFCAILTCQAYLRQKLRGVYFGDSAIFVRRDVFEELGGFPDQPLLEDLEFSRRLEAYGKTCRLSQRVHTSGRRFQGRKIQTLLQWGAIHILYRFGVSAERLARFYGTGRQSTS